MYRRFALLVFISLALWVGYTSPVGAHTAGKIQLSAEPAGPFKITVWSWPDPAKVGEFHITAAVVMAEDASPVLDGNLLVQLEPLDGGQIKTEQATTENSVNKFLYEAIFDVEESGLHKVSLIMTGNDGSSGEASFELDFREDLAIDPLYLIPVTLGLAAVALIVYARFSRSGAGASSSSDGTDR